MSEPTAIGQEIRTPRAAAVAGIIFALVLGTVLILMRLTVPGGVPQPQWINDPTLRRYVSISVALVPFAGIAFIWFIGVIRSRLGVHEDRFFASVFLGSGLIFVAILFVSAALLGTALRLSGEPRGISTQEVHVLGTLVSTLMRDFASRMESVFTLSVTTIGMRTKIIPRWLQVVGYLSAALLLLFPTGAEWIQLVFPAWVLIISLNILVLTLRGRTEDQQPTVSPGQ